MKPKKKGSVSAYVLLSLSVIMIGSAAAVSNTYTGMARAKSDKKAAVAYSVAQSTLEEALSLAYKDVLNTKGTFVSRNDDLLSSMSDLADSVTKAKATVTPVNGGAAAWVTSSVTVDGQPSSIRVYTRAKDVGIWNNAIFAGSGASGQSINGNVDIRGSVHILGDGEPFIDTNGNSKWDKAETYTDTNNNGVYNVGEPFVDADNNGVWSPAEPYNDVNWNGVFDPPLTETDLNSNLSGTAGIFNHYAGIDNSLLMMVPPPPVVGGIQSLSAELRVKNGLVGLSGNAAVGNSGAVNGGTVKSNVDGTYVSAGFAGNQGANNVFSDNGANNTYDLGNLDITFPLITGIGADKYQDKDGTVWNTQEEFLNARSLTLPVATVKSNTAAFSYGPDQYGNSVKFTPAGNGNNPPATLEVNGIVKVADGFQLGSKDKIYYKGSGTLYSPGTIKVDGDLLPLAGLVFPTTTRIGLLAKKDLMLATGNGSSQLKLAGAFYAQGKIKSAKQNQVLGTFVSSYYDMGTNVPSIYQVPTLSKNLPPGMPGEKPYITMKRDSWRLRKAD